MLYGGMKTMSEEYWKQRCLVVEERMDQLEAEIRKLRGMKPLTKEFIEEHNRKVKKCWPASWVDAKGIPLSEGGAGKIFFRRPNKINLEGG
jgi:hypothetical protein